MKIQSRLFQECLRIIMILLISDRYCGAEIEECVSERGNVNSMSCSAVH